LDEHDISPVIGCMRIYLWKSNGTVNAAVSYMKDMARNLVLTISEKSRNAIDAPCTRIAPDCHRQAYGTNCDYCRKI